MAKLSSSIRQAQVRTELDTLACVLTTSVEAARELGEELNRRYTATPRRLILERLHKCLDDTTERINQDALLAFVQTQWDGVTATTKDKHLYVTLRVLATVSVGLAASQLAELLSKADQEHSVPQITHKDLKPAGFRFSDSGQLGSLLLATLKRGIETQSISLPFMIGWHHLLLPGICARYATQGIDPAQAAVILELLAIVDEEVVPDELVFSSMGLARIAQVSPRDSFWKTELGQLALGSVSFQASDPKDESNTEKIVPFKGTAQRIVTDIIELAQKLEERANSLRADLEQKSEDTEEVARYDRLQSALENVNQERDSLNARVQVLSKSNEDLQGELRECQNQLVILERELRLKSQEAETRLTLMQERLTDQLRKRLSIATMNLRDHVKAMLEEVEPITDQVSGLGFAFDAMHQRLLKMMGESDENRIPVREILDSRERADD